jgi:hypothetical protein
VLKGLTNGAADELIGLWDSLFVDTVIFLVFNILGSDKSE